MTESLLHASPSGSDLQSPRILVVDDEPSICAIVQKSLTHEGYQVATATHAATALERLRHESFTLLITDINMPAMSGLELAEQAREAQALLGIIVMTAYGSVDNMARALRAGIDDFITKPFNIDDLRLTVSRALDRQRLRHENLRLQMIAQMFEYSEALNSTLDLPALYRVIRDVVSRELGATGIGVWVARGNDLVLDYEYDLPASLRGRASELATQCFRAGTFARASVDHELNAGESVLLGVPLQVRDEWIGALVAVQGAHVPPASEELLGLIANQAAPAIRNAQQYTAIRELDRIKSEFIGIASHELRTPLSLVLGYSSLLRNRVQGRDRDALQQVIDGARRMSDIIDDLINLRHAESGEIRLALAEADLWMVVRDAVAELDALANARQVTLRLDLPDQPLLMMADAEKLALTFANLIDNATKFNDPGGVVRVTGAIDRRDDGIDAIIEVQDTGWGIERQHQAHIFDRFYQAAPSATRPRNGLGVGLSLSRTFVELHGGRIEVQSQPEQGSLFRVRLPVCDVERSQQKDA
jgi:signal transduction histidine kinase